MVKSAVDRTDRDGPERTCAVTRESRSREELLRFVASPADEIVPDLKCKLPGRGVWITATQTMVEQAARRGAFARSLKKQVKVNPDLSVRTGELLEQDALQSLAMANKAGLVGTGAFHVEKALARGTCVAVIEATDGSPDGRRKIGQTVRRIAAERTEAPQDPAPRVVAWVHLFTSAQMDLALGRTNVIHAALKAGAASEAFLARCRRLAAYRGQVAAAPEGTGPEYCDGRMIPENGQQARQAQQKGPEVENI